MNFQGRLLEAVKNRKIILFAGAGVGQAAGLYGSDKLRDYIYEKAKELNWSEPNNLPLERLSARLQKNTGFGRAWLTRILSDYFCSPANYTQLDDHIKLLRLNCLDSIFTTNYDLVFEQAAIKGSLDLRVKSIDSVTSANIYSSKGELNCYKMHGCADNVTRYPNSASRLVVSKNDWSHETKNRREMLNELAVKVSSGCVVIFVGFNLSNGDNSDISRAVFEGNGDILKTDHWQTSSCYALFRNPTEDDVDIYKEDFSCEVVKGDFSTFVEELSEACKFMGVDGSASIPYQAGVNFHTINCSESLSKSVLDDCLDSFYVWHDDTIEEEFQEDCSIDGWHEPPSIKMLSHNRYVDRDCLTNAVGVISNSIKWVEKNRKNRVLSILGERGAGKSVVTLQLSKYCYEQLKQPVIILKENSFLEVKSNNDSSLVVQGWEAKSLDSILQPFFNDSIPVPIIVADNQPHRKSKVEQLGAYLSNHGKPCVILVSEHIQSETDASKVIKIPNELSNNELESLFDIVSFERREIIEKRTDLLLRAKNSCKRDILIVMYEWLDRNFRPFNEIISESANLISKSHLLRQVYILIAAFHVLGYKPTLSLIVRAADYSADDVLKSLNGGDYGLRLSSDSILLYRHTLISSKLLSEMGVTPRDQLKSIVSCIQVASASDVKFFKDVLDYLFSLGSSEFSVQDIELVKEATEKNTAFEEEWDLHHKYAAYLARDSQDIEYYEEARRYCDKALSMATDDNSFSSIYHTLGNIEYKQYQLSYLVNPEMAKHCFERAVEKFELSKQLRTFQTEHAYVTHIDFINFQLKNTSQDLLADIDSEKEVELKATKFAIYWEALKVVDRDQQRYLSERIQTEEEASWKNLPLEVRNNIRENSYDRKPNKILLDCYIDQCLMKKTEDSRREINDIVNLHRESSDPDILIPVMEGSKRAFLLDAESRSNILRAISSQIFDPSSSITNQTRARGIRLLAIDSFVSGQFEYLAKHVLHGAADLYREIRPRFLDVEYVLPREYYACKGLDDQSSLNLFIDKGPDCFYDVTNALIMEKPFSRYSSRGHAHSKYTMLNTPSFGKFSLKVPTVEILSSKNSFHARCIVNYSAFGMGGNLQRPSNN